MAASPPSHSRRWISRLKGPLPIAALLICHNVLGLTAVSRKSMTFDEGLYLASGYSYWTLGDYRLHPDNGLWPQRWVGLPLFLGGFHPPDLEVDSAWQGSSVFTISDRFVFASGNDADSLLWWGRAAMVVPATLLGVIVYLWSRQLFGRCGGLISLTLYAFSPVMLANNFLTTSDAFATLFLTAAVWSVWILLHRVTPFTIIATALATSGLLLSKYSGLIVFPMGAVLLGIRLSDLSPLSIRLGKSREIRGLARQVTVLSALALFEMLLVALVIWASYGFRYSAFSYGVDQAPHFAVTWEEIDAILPNGTRALVNFARDHRLLPEAYLYGFACQVKLITSRNAFLHGALSRTGWTSFFLYCIALKTRLEVFAVLGMAGWGAWAFGRRKATAPGVSRQTGLYDVAPLAALLFLYMWFAMRGSLNIGHRHVLPIYPALFVLAGAAAQWFKTARLGRNVIVVDRDSEDAVHAPLVAAAVRRTARAIVVVAIVIGSLEAFLCWPNYLAYFNVLAGGPAHGYRWLVDSSLDWGQDLKELKAWLDTRPADTVEPAAVYLIYFGTALPEYYGIEAQHRSCHLERVDVGGVQPLTGGVYCVSATMLQSVYLLFPGRWNAEYEHYYQQLRTVFEGAAPADGAKGQTASLRTAPTPEQLRELYQCYNDLRMGRLVSCLRRREPDDEVGHSILIYRLSHADVARSLNDPPCELQPKPEVPVFEHIAKLLSLLR